MISRATALDRYFENGSPHFLLSRLLAPDWMPPADSGYLARTLAHCLLPDGTDALTQALYFETTAKLTGDMLVKVDRMSMANSLEVRCPMLDHKLAELAARIPHRMESSKRPGEGHFHSSAGASLAGRNAATTQARVRSSAGDLVSRPAAQTSFGTT